MKKNIYTQRTETLCCTPETNTTLYINHISIKKLKKLHFVLYILKDIQKLVCEHFNRNSLNQLNKTSTTVFCIQLCFAECLSSKKKNSPNKVMS